MIKFFESNFFFFWDNYYINPLIESVPCLIIGGFILFQMEKLIDYQADSDARVNIVKGLKISAVLFILGGFWILLNAYYLEYDIVTIILKWTLFPIYSLIFDLIHDDRFFNDVYIVFINNILFCFFPITIFILSVYFIRISNKLDEIKGSGLNVDLPAHQEFNLFLKIILILLIVSHIVVLGFILYVVPLPEINGYLISGISLNAVFLLALLKKRKWGFYGYIISSVLGFFIATYTNVDPDHIWGLIPGFLIFLSLNLGGENNGWKQLT
jgi:hypothetical protein